MPKCYPLFERYKPDVYLFPNHHEYVPEEKFKQVFFFLFGVIGEQVFGPNVRIKAIHYWEKDDASIFEVVMNQKFPKMMKFIREDVKHVPNVQGKEENVRLKTLQKGKPKTNTGSGTFQYSLPKSKRLLRNILTRQKTSFLFLIRFQEYDVVAKFRFDVYPRPGFPFDLSPPFGDIERIVPHVVKMWNEHPDYKEEMINGRTKSHDTLWEGYTLGGAMIQNPPHYYKNIDEKKV